MTLSIKVGTEQFRAGSKVSGTVSLVAEDNTFIENFDISLVVRCENAFEAHGEGYGSFEKCNVLSR